MKNFLPTSFFLLLAATCVAAPLAQPTARDTTMVIVQTVPARFPLRMEHSGLTQGEASVALSVDQRGNLLDVLVTSYSRREFADEAVAALRRSRFKSATVRGEAVPAVQEVRFTFTRTGVIMENLNGFEVLARAVNRHASGAPDYRARALRELDHIPVPVKVVAPGVPASLSGANSVATVTVEFYIDETGTVRVPAVLDRSISEHAFEAVEAVRQWKFEPPTVNGRPVLVLARQEIRFTPN